MVRTGAVVASPTTPSSLRRPTGWPSSKSKSENRPFSSSRKLLRSTRISAKIHCKTLPYSMNALEPYMSRETLERHWEKHHNEHVASINRLISGTELEEMELEDLILVSYKKGNPHLVFKHAAQIWNHDFFWKSMKPGGGGIPSGTLLELIDRDFGSFDALLKALKAAATSQFGSGWAWLAYKANSLDVGNAINPCPSELDHKLVVAKTPNEINPLVWDYSPLLAIDVWEHAYYLDYENRREEYVTMFLEKLVSWEVVGLRLEMAVARAWNRTKQDIRMLEEDEVEIAEDGEGEVEMYPDGENDTEAE